MLPRSVIAVPRSSRAAIVSNKRKIGRWRSKAHVLDETFRVNSAFNAELFVTPPHPVAMEFNLFGERRSGHWVKGGGVSKRESGGVIRIANCKSKICSIRDENKV